MRVNRVSAAIQQFGRILLARDVSGHGDGKLLQRFIDQRDEAAFEALVRRHGPMVLGVCRRILANDHDAEDAFQATFLVLARRAAAVVPRGVVGNWLYGVAANVARKARAVSARRQSRERLMENFPDPGGRPEGNLPDLQAVLDQELSSFPDKYRIPLVLCGLEGKTPKQAALELGWPEGTFSGRLSRARQFLARRLARHGIALPGAAATALLFERAASATVPAALLASTIRLGSLSVAGTGAGAALVPTGIAALAEGVAPNYWINKVSWGAAILLLASVLGAGGFIAYHTAIDKPTTMKRDDGPSVSTKPLMVDLGAGIKMEFVLLPKGTFTMGSPADEKGHNSAQSLNPFLGPENLHRVEISKPFYMAKYTVTLEQYEVLSRQKLLAMQTDGSNGKRGPIRWVTWLDAQDFCRKMRNIDKQGRQFRLPTEAEWEYACRAGSKTAYYFGNDPGKLGDYAWFAGNADGRPHGVGEKKPNAWGLFDMHGNIWQWCEDFWGPYEGLDAKDPVRSGDPFTVLGAAGHHVLRGGCWNADAIHCRAACRGEDGFVMSPDYGFRVAFRPD